MKRLSLLLAAIASAAMAAHCQLPLTSFTTSPAHLAVLQTVNQREARPSYLLAINAAVPVKHTWTYAVEVSTMEKYYPHAVDYAPRCNHFSVTGMATRKFGARHDIQASRLITWDKSSLSTLTKSWIVDANLRFRNSAALISLEHRSDVFADAFSLAEDITFHRKPYGFAMAVARYSVFTKQNNRLFTELRAGDYYGYANYAARVGEHFVVGHSLDASVDVEFNRLVKTSSFDGGLARLKASWKISKVLSMNTMTYHNTYSGLSALMADVVYKSGNHVLRIEYRDVRDRSFTYIETDHPWFASRVMVQYFYR